MFNLSYTFKDNKTLQNCHYLSDNSDSNYTHIIFLKQLQQLLQNIFLSISRQLNDINPKI